MSIKDTYKNMKELLGHIVADLEKSENGNKAASQRVRTGTVRLEKVAKAFRKESISHEKKTKGQKKSGKPVAAAKKGAHAHAKGGKPAAAKSKPAAAPVKSKAAAPAKGKPKAKPAQAKTTVRSPQLSVKRATAKLPVKRAGSR